MSIELKDLSESAEKVWKLLLRHKDYWEPYMKEPHGMSIDDLTNLGEDRGVIVCGISFLVLLNIIDSVKKDGTKYYYIPYEFLHRDYVVDGDMFMTFGDARDHIAQLFHTIVSGAEDINIEDDIRAIIDRLGIDVENIV